MYKRVTLPALSLIVLLLALTGYWSEETFAKAENNVFDSPLPMPMAEFYADPFDPSIYIAVNFWDTSYDPVNSGFTSMTWDFGDGTTSNDLQYTSHKYAADGDYTVTHTVTTTDGRTASVSRVISVRTRDISLTKFARPKDGRVGQQRKFSIGISNKIQPETVRVELYVSDPSMYDGFRPIGFSEQYVPVKSGKKTTDFPFAYTFTEADARLGKVNFKAVAYIINGRDAYPADNAYITLSVTVKAKNGRSEDADLETDEILIDDVANGDALPVTLTEGQIQNQRYYLPFVTNNNR